MSRRTAEPGCKLANMRMQVELRSEDEDPLRKLAILDGRSVREQGSWLLHLKVQEEARLRLDDQQPVGEVA